MTKYISKSAVVAEIERRKLYHIDLTEYNSGYKNAIFDVLSFIDTLEVKEVDLEKEFDNYTKKIWACNVQFEPFTHLYNCAKHFFELGMRANNPVTASDRGMVEEIIINLKRVESDYQINLTKEMEWLRNQVKKENRL